MLENSYKAFIAGRERLSKYSTIVGMIGLSGLVSYYTQSIHGVEISPEFAIASLFVTLSSNLGISEPDERIPHEVFLHFELIKMLSQAEEKYAIPERTEEERRVWVANFIQESKVR